MLILSVPAILIGIACSLILIVAMKVAALLQRVLWSNLPTQLGERRQPAVDHRHADGDRDRGGSGHSLQPRARRAGSSDRVVNRRSHCHRRAARTLAALILGLAGGVSLGPEHPIMVVNIALAVAVGSRLFPRVSSLDWTILAASGTIGALFGTPVAAALIFRKPSIAATIRHCGIASLLPSSPPPPAR